MDGTTMYYQVYRISRGKWWVYYISCIVYFIVYSICCLVVKVTPYNTIGWHNKVLMCSRVVELVNKIWWWVYHISCIVCFIMVIGCHQVTLKPYNSNRWDHNVLTCSLIDRISRAGQQMVSWHVSCIVYFIAYFIYCHLVKLIPYNSNGWDYNVIMYSQVDRMSSASQQMVSYNISCNVFYLWPPSQVNILTSWRMGPQYIKVFEMEINRGGQQN